MHPTDVCTRVYHRSLVLDDDGLAKFQSCVCAKDDEIIGDSKHSLHCKLCM